MLSTLIPECLKLHETELKRHNDASHPLNILLFLLETDFAENDEITELNKKIIENDFTVLMNIPVAYGGSGKALHTWILCDLPLSLYISIRINKNRLVPQHRKGIETIINKAENNGWRCCNKGNIGKFRGPGKKEDECPIATLNVLKLLTVTGKNEYKEAKQTGIRTILNLWKERKTRKAYLFAMGTDFKKIKYPMIWYDILNVVNVLSYYPQAVQTPEFSEMYAILEKKIQTNDYVPESVYQYWKNYDFGQKKVNSIYIEKTMLNIKERIRLPPPQTDPPLIFR